MALTQASLSAKIKSEIEALYGAADDSTRLVKFCDALAKAIVDEITQNAVVTVNGVQGGGGTAAGTIT